MYNIYKQIIQGKQFHLKPSIAEKEGLVDWIYWAEADEYKGYIIHRKMPDADNWIPLLPVEVGELFLTHEATDFELVYDAKEIKAVLDFLNILCSANPFNDKGETISVLSSTSWNNDEEKLIEFGFLHCDTVDKILRYEGSTTTPLLELNIETMEAWSPSSKFMWANSSNVDYRLSLLFCLLEKFKEGECNAKLYEDNYLLKAGIRVSDFTCWIKSQYLNETV